ncbi:MAG: T9SS type A sorting domain-containing protein [Bacteroidaceae bacterium]|nr:T9SS type A sorting domain-containing protein [Bacteroidaceae bacterium]
MKKTLLLIAALIVCIAAQAQTSGQTLVVWLTDGTRVVHDLADQPETTFQDGALYINSATVSVSYPLEKVARYTYEGNFPEVGIQQVNAGEVRVSQGADAMRFDGLPDGTALELYSPDGRRLQSLKAAAGRPTEVSLKGLPTGTYIVKVGDTSYKFYKK